MEFGERNDLLHTIIFAIVGLIAAVVMMIVTLASITIVIFVVAAIGNLFSRPSRAPAPEPPH